MEKSILTASAGKRRIAVIDIVKGLTIYGVVCTHSGPCPWWLTPTLVNSIFFFLSGIFFVPSDWRSLIVKRFWQLIVPMLIFYVLGYPFDILMHYWDQHGTLAGYDWLRIFDIFRIEARTDYLNVNIPVWFLMCLFMVQIYYNAISRFPQWVAGAAMVVAFVFWDFFYSIPKPFMMNNALAWMAWFTLGNLTGGWIKSVCSRVTALDNLSILRPIYFLGANTLAILCMHVPMSILLKRIFFKIFREHTITHTFIIAVLVCLICTPLLMALNKYLPVWVGKGRKKKGG